MLNLSDMQGINLSSVLNYIEGAILIYFLVGNSFFGILLLSAMCYARQHALSTHLKDYSHILGSNMGPRITVIVPAYNEAVVITESVKSFLSLHYPNLEVVVINDGSVDDTLNALVKHFEMKPLHSTYEAALETQPIRGFYRSSRHPNLLVVDKENGGKPDALNAGLNLARSYLVCTVDSDTLVEPDALQRLVVPFLEDDNTVAAGAFLSVVNGSRVWGGRVEAFGVPRRALAGFQLIEYIRGFAFGRVGWNYLGGNLIISGAFGLFQRERLIDIGGFTHDTPGGEDMELVLHLRRQGYEQGRPNRIAFVPGVAAWTEVPSSLRTLRRQRERWHRGLAYVLWRHRKVAFRPRYGLMGFVSYPYFLLVELLGPVVEVLGLGLIPISLLFGQFDLSFAFRFFLVSYGFSLLLTTMSMLLMELGEAINVPRLGHGDPLLLAKWIVLENFGYRQLTVFWRIMGLVQFFLRQQAWGTMDRRGFGNHEDGKPR